MPDPLIRRHAEFSALGKDPHHIYRELAAEPLDEDMLRSIREATQAGYPLVSEAYKARVMTPSGMRTGPGKPGRTTAVQLRP